MKIQELKKNFKLQK